MMGKRTASTGPDYRLLITPTFDERRQLTTTLFLLETIKVFASFRYELAVEVNVSASALRFTIRGLKAPDLSLPAAGHARFRREFDGLRGTYEIMVEGLDRTTSSFTVRISEKAVLLIHPPARTFLDLFTDPELWPAD